MQRRLDLSTLIPAVAGTAGLFLSRRGAGGREREPLHALVSFTRHRCSRRPGVRVLLVSRYTDARFLQKPFPAGALGEAVRDLLA